MVAGDADTVLAERMAVQHLTSPPVDLVHVVRLLVGVQCQDAPLARFSLGQRTSSTDDVVRAALDSGAVLRTHILRPTWHFVAAEDLRWILALTSTKVESGMAARHRQLQLDPATTERALEALTSLLANGRFMTRQEIGVSFADTGLPSAGEQVGHLLMQAELRAVVCSGPMRGRTHTYGLVDELVPPASPLDRVDAIRLLVERFFRGHGPAADTDLNRWTKLTLTEIRAALAELATDDVFVPTTVDGTTLWSAPDPPLPTPDAARAFLVPLFDEVFLSYRDLNFPRRRDHPLGDRPLSVSETGGGVVVLDRRDVGWWKRKEVGRDVVRVTLATPASLRISERRLIGEAAARLADFTGRTVDVVHV